MKKYIFFVIYFFSATIAFSQYASIYPVSWFVGMKWNKVQLLIKGEQKDFNQAKITIPYPGVKLGKMHQLDNSMYLCVDVLIAPDAKPGMVPITFTQNGKTQVLQWPLKARRMGKGVAYAQGVTSKDMIYFLMPDRFANGNPANDSLSGMQEMVYGRSHPKGRHGGDLEGVEQHLDYIKELGSTALWLTPVLINDMPRESFHGYAFTDHYKIDPRFGGEKAYQTMIDAAHAKGIKIIQDAVYNHVGSEHITVKDKPCKDWLNEWPSFQKTSYKDQPAFDPYASESDKKIFRDGWFTESMPDLNQRNPYVANYLIQHALWTIETFGIDGWRIDTYAYNDPDFVNRCNQAIMDEYPAISLFGETWVTGIPNQSFFAYNNYTIPFKSNLPGVTDFQLLWAMQAALNENFGWNEGLTKLYTTLASDFVYKDPYKNCIFLDNHDLDRIYGVIGKNMDKMKQAITWLLTLRGIPQLYYGTELLMDKFKDPTDAEVRKDFPGGWKGDSINCFVSGGRSAAQNEIFNYIKTLGNYRKNSTALQTGKLMQFVPYDGIYVYFRYDAKRTVMVMCSSNDQKSTVLLDRFAERLNGFSKMKNILTEEIISIEKAVIMRPKGTLVMELLK